MVLLFWESTKAGRVEEALIEWTPKGVEEPKPTEPP